MTNDQIAEIRTAIAKECPRWYVGVNFLSHEAFGHSRPTVAITMYRFTRNGGHVSFQEQFSEDMATDPDFDIGKSMRILAARFLKRHFRRQTK
jgi:hypothetical protein